MRAVAHSAGVPTQEELARENEHNLVVRRIVFSSLALLLILTSVLSLVGLLSPIVMLLPVSGISLYIAHVRRQMQAMRSAIRQQRIISQHNQKPTSTNYAELLARSKVVREKNEVLEHWIPLSERIEKVEQELSGITLLPKGSASAHHEWTPQEVPTPTYVSAPKAVTAKRIIDLTIPGAWSEEQAKLNSEVSEVSPHRDQVFDQEDGGSARAVNS